MTFWNWRRSNGQAATHGSAAVAVGAELAPIELYTTDARIVAWIDPGGHRVTDLLTSQDVLRLWRPSPGPLDETGIPPMPGDEADDARGEWQSLATADVILAMPPEWRASRQLRLHRRLRRAALTAGPFIVTGNVHLPPGGEVSGHLLRQPFLPLTDAYILHEAEPSFEHVVSVAIVNTVHVGQLTPLITLA